MHVINKTNIAVKYRLIFKGGQQVSSLVFGIVLARILTPAEFGVIAIVNMIIYYANNFTNFGLNNALVQKSSIDTKHINTVFTIDLIISVLMLLFTIFYADSIANFFHNSSVGHVLRVMSLYYVITTFYHIPVALLRRDIDFKFLTVCEFLEAFLSSIIAIILALAGYSYWSIVIASLTMQALVAIVLMLKTGWVPRLIIRENMQSMYSFGLWSFIRSQLELLVSKVDYFVIGRYLDTWSLGIYEKSFELTGRAMSGLSMPLHGVFFSTFSRVKKDNCQVKKVFLDSSSILALVCYPCLFGLIGVAPHFVMSCLGEQWERAIIPIQILAGGSVIRVLFGNIANVNVAIGKYRAHTLVNALVAAVFVSLCFLFVRYGIVAVSYIYFIYCILAFFASFSLVYVNCHVRFRELFSAIWCPLAGSFLMFSIVWFLSMKFFTDYYSFVQFVYLVVVGCVVYVSWIYFFVRIGVVTVRMKN